MNSNNINPEFNFTHLPNEVKSNILDQCETKEFKNLTEVNTNLNEIVYSSPTFLSEQIKKHINIKDLIRYKISLVPDQTDNKGYNIEFYILDYKIYNVTIWFYDYDEIDFNPFIDKNGNFTVFVDKCSNHRRFESVEIVENVYLIHHNTKSPDSKYGINVSHTFDIYFTKTIFKQLLLDIHRLQCQFKSE